MASLRKAHHRISLSSNEQDVEIIYWLGIGGPTGPLDVMMLNDFFCVFLHCSRRLSGSLPLPPNELFAVVSKASKTRAYEPDSDLLG